jgi:hypothetical protein
MKINKFELPIASVRVYKNRIPIHFEIEPLDYGIYLNDGSYKKPEGLYRITIDMGLLQLGDVLFCEFDRGVMENDGGDEYSLNIVGTIENYTVGMGTNDSQYINECFGENGTYVPYDVMSNTDRGYEVHIIDNPKKYQDREYFQQIYFTIAWESGITDEAWTLISFVTC